MKVCKLQMLPSGPAAIFPYSVVQPKHVNTLNVYRGDMQLQMELARDNTGNNA